MTNTAKQIVYFNETAQAAALPREETKNRAKNKKSRVLTREDQEIVEALNSVKREIEILHNRYDQMTDPLLIDSIIYELKAANIRYMYYLQLCKEKDIICG